MHSVDLSATAEFFDHTGFGAALIRVPIAAQ